MYPVFNEKNRVKKEHENYTGCHPPQVFPITGEKIRKFS